MSHLSELKYKNAQEILCKYDESTKKAIEEIVIELKKDCQTYEDVVNQINLLRMQVEYLEPDKYTYLFKEIEVALQKEKNALPLTKCIYRARRVTTGKKRVKEIIPIWVNKQEHYTKESEPINLPPLTVKVNITNMDNLNELISNIIEKMHELQDFRLKAEVI